MFSSPQASEPGYFVGDIAADDLIRDYDEFSSSYADFAIEHDDLTILKNISDQITLVVLFGTWCHDSVREVPRMIKLLNLVSNNNILLRLKAVAPDKAVKLSPQDNVADYQLKYTPTFVVYRGGVEIGRIIERPEHSLTQDLSQILQRD